MSWLLYDVYVSNLNNVTILLKYVLLSYAYMLGYEYVNLWDHDKRMIMQVYDILLYALHKKIFDMLISQMKSYNEWKLSSIPKELMIMFIQGVNLCWLMIIFMNKW